MSSLRSDAAVLMAARLAGAIVPLISIPVMARRLGPSGYGEIAIALAVYGVLATVTTFGFLISANRAVTLSRHDQRAVQSIFQSVIALQLVVALVATVIVVVLSALSVLPESLTQMLYLAIASVAIGAFFPSWAFQGLRLLKEGAIVEVSSRLVLVVALFIFVQDTGDELLAFATQVGWVVPAAVYALVRFSVAGYLTLRLRITRRSVIVALREGFAPFLTNFFVMSYSSLSSVVLGAMSGAASVANYAGAEKLTQAARIPSGPLKQAFFPRLVTAMADKDTDAIARLSRLLAWAAMPVFVAAAVFCFVFGPLILTWYLGPGYELSHDVIRFLALALPCLGVTVWCETLLQASGLAARSTIAFGVGAVAHLLYVFPLIALHGAVGLAVAMLITETIVAVVMVMQLRRARPRWQVTE